MISRRKNISYIRNLHCSYYCIRTYFRYSVRNSRYSVRTNFVLPYGRSRDEEEQEGGLVYPTLGPAQKKKRTLLAALWEISKEPSHAYASAALQQGPEAKFYHNINTDSTVIRS